MTQDFSAYDQGRDFSRKAVRSLCYAPHTNLYFDRRGNARVCCHNWSQPAGNITQQTLDEIWSSAQAVSLRASLERYELPESCGFCRFQSSEGWFGGAVMRQFDRFDVSETPPRWPRRIEFSISNSCNLECVMCDGDFSSAIRTRREARPPMARLYSDDVLEQFRKYLPHLSQAKFLGGEPFLAVEHYKIWDMMLQDGLQTPCHVTTNGTQYDARIEGLLGRLPFSFAVSLDGARKETIERIRLNTRYDEVMRNVRRFRDYALERGTTLSLTFCLMRPNWEEFGEYCAMADEWNVRVSVNTVRFPPGLSLYTLPAGELRKVVAAMERQAVDLAPRLGLNKAVWFNEFERLRRKAEAASIETPAPPAAPASRDVFILGIEDEHAADLGSITLHFLKRFSKARIVVAQAAGGRRLPHEYVMDVANNSGSALRLCAVPQWGRGERFVFLTPNVAPPHHDVDELFSAFIPPLNFAALGETIDDASPYLVRCGCAGPCGHAREALFCAFGVDVIAPDWQLPDPSCFGFTPAAAAYFAAWQDFAGLAGADGYWREPLMAGLIVMLWSSGLAQTPPLALGRSVQPTPGRMHRISNAMLAATSAVVPCGS